MGDHKGTNTYGNNDILTDRLNACKNPRGVLAALALFLEPRIQNGNHIADEGEITIRDVLPVLDETKRN